MTKYKVMVTMTNGDKHECEMSGNTAENIFDQVKAKAHDVNKIGLVQLEEIEEAPARKVIMQSTLALPGEGFETYEFENDTLEMFDGIQYGNDTFFVVGINGETPKGIMPYNEIKQLDPHTHFRIMRKEQ